MPSPEHLILVTDDNAAARYATCRTLEAAGFRTVQSAGGADALQIAKRGVSAVVLDVHLPDVHGFEVCRLLRSHPTTAHLPVVHVSAVHIAPEDKVTGLAAGADAYYVNPVEPSVLVATLRALIHSRELTEGVRHRESRYRSVFQNAPVAMALIDDNGDLADINAEWSRLLQWPRENLVGKPLKTLSSPKHAAALEQVQPQWKTKTWTGTAELLTPSSVPVSLDLSCGPSGEAGWSVVVAFARSARDA